MHAFLKSATAGNQGISKWAMLLIVLLSVVAGHAVHAKTLRIACGTDYYPYAQVTDENELDGSLYDLWKLWSEKTGTAVTFVPGPLRKGVHSLQANKAEVMCGLFETPGRRRTLAFSDPLFGVEGVLFVRSTVNASDATVLKVKVGTVAGDFANDYLAQNYPNLGTTVFATYGELREAVRNKTVDAFIYDYPQSLPRFKDHAPPEGFRRLQSLYKKYLRAVVKKGDEELVAHINEGLEQISGEEKLLILKKRGLLRFDDSQILLGASISAGLLLLLIGLLIYVTRIRSRLKLAVGGSNDWLAIIQQGENDGVEFKSSLRWDMREQKVNKVLEHVIAKTMSAFMNADGGRLFIGVDDDGNLLGLEQDYQSFSKKKNADGFLLALSSTINKYLGKKAHRFVEVHLASLEGKDLCVITLRTSDTPVFVTSGNKEEFYIRAQASSQPMGLKDTHEYISSKWGK